MRCGDIESDVIATSAVPIFHASQYAPVDQLQNDPQTFGRFVELVHGHDVPVTNALHDLDLCGHALYTYTMCGIMKISMR
jgi:hypothetical protein